MVRFISDHSVAILEAAMLAVRHTADFLVHLLKHKPCDNTTLCSDNAINYSTELSRMNRNQIRLDAGM